MKKLEQSFMPNVATMFHLFALRIWGQKLHNDEIKQSFCNKDFGESTWHLKNKLVDPISIFF